MANLTETGPKPIDGSTYAKVKGYFNRAQFIGAHYAHEGLLYAYVPGYTPSEDTDITNVLLWSRTFFEYTKEGVQPKIEKGPDGLSLMGQNGNVTIKRGELRIVDPISSASESDHNLAEVVDSGYLITQHAIRRYLQLRARVPNFEFSRSLRRMSPESQLEQILTGVEEGQKPPLLMENPFVKVTTQLAGARLAVVFFEPLVGSRSPFFQDAVVINPKTHELVARKVVRPLSKAKWGQVPRPSLLDEFPHGIPIKY